MSLTLALLKQKQTYSLGTSETNLYTVDKRADAINLAIQEVINEFDIPQYTVSTTLTFTSGVASLPTDCLRPMKLVNNQNTEYVEVDFDKFSFNIGNTYMIGYNTGSNIEQITVYPALTGSLTFWYIQQPTTLATDSDTCRFSLAWANAIAEKSVALLLLNSRNADIGQLKEQKANNLLAKAWQTERGRLTGKEDQRLTSVYAKKSLLGSSGSSMYAYTTTTTSMALTWLTVTASQTMTTNYGYNTNSASRIDLQLPTSATLGDIIQVVGQGTGGWRITQGAGQQMIIGELSTTVGVSGYIESTYYTDNMALEYLGNNSWTRIAMGGTVTVV